MNDNVACGVHAHRIGTGESDRDVGDGRAGSQQELVLRSGRRGRVHQVDPVVQPTVRDLPVARDLGPRAGKVQTLEEICRIREFLDPDGFDWVRVFKDSTHENPLGAGPALREHEHDLVRSEANLRPHRGRVEPHMGVRQLSEILGESPSPSG